MGIAEPLTEKIVADILVDALHTSRRLPGVVGPRYANVWHSLIGMAPIDDSYPEDKRVRIYPSAEALETLDTVYTWMTWLPLRARKILWLHADGNSWRWIARQVGITPQYCRKLWRQYVADIITLQKTEVVTCGHKQDATGTYGH